MSLGFRLKIRVVLLAFFALGSWCTTFSAAHADDSDVVINEVMYNPPPDLGADEDYEYVELFNRGEESVDISGWRLQGTGYTFPPGTTVPAKDFRVLCHNPQRISDYCGVTNLCGPFPGSLDNGGEDLILLDDSPSPVVIDRVRYDDAFPWPAEADGAGSSLELRNPMLNNEVAESWAASLLSAGYGTPGILNSTYTDSTPALISAVSRTPQSPTHADQINVVASVFDADGIAFVRLYYDTGTGFIPTQMLDDGNSGDAQAGDGVFGGFIPAQPDGTLVKYYILAQDTTGVSSSLPFDAPSNWLCCKVEDSSVLEGEIVVNEIMYNNPYSLDSDSEWIELFNTTDRTIDLSWWTLRDENDPHTFLFPEGTQLSPQAYLVICRDPALFQNQYPGVPFIGGFDFNFGDGGDAVKIFNANGVLMDFVAYNDASPWVQAADGLGASLECVDPATDNNVFSAWGASLPPYPQGTPGQPNTVYSPGSCDAYVVINEIMYHPTSRNPILYNDPAFKKSINPDLREYVELFNRGDKPVDLSGWRFTDGILLQFPGGLSLDPGHYLAVYKDGREFESLYPSVEKKAGPYEDTLDNGGEKIVLSNAKGVPVDYVRYRDEEPWPIAADGDGCSLELVNPNAENNNPRNWRNSIEVSPLNSLNPPDYPDIDERYMNPDVPHGTPGTQNSRFAVNNSPFIEDVSHAPTAPTSSDSVVVRAKITDSDGISSAFVQYQVVRPGQYVAKFDRQFDFSVWPSAPMNDDGVDGDEVAHDGIYSVNLGRAFHRELVRYRVVALDSGNRRAEVPYPEDPVPNYAYFVYDGVPDYHAYYHNTGSDRGMNLRLHGGLGSIPVYHLIARERDVLEAQYHEFPFGGWPRLAERNRYRWLGTFVFEDKVYDHVMFRARGGVHRYDWPKRSWKIHFQKGHYFRGRDNDGAEFPRQRERINLNADQHNDGRPRGETGMYHTLAYYLFKKANVAAPSTAFVHFRVIDNESEEGNRPGIERLDWQYYGDFFGLFVDLEVPNADFLSNNGRDPAGNLYDVKPESPPEGNRMYYKQTNLWSADYSDVLEFDRGFQGLSGDKRQYLIDHLDLDEYLSWRSVSLWIGHYDQGNHNYYFYHDPATDRWEVYPWDLDNTFCSSVHGLSGETEGSLNWAAERVWRNYNDFPDLVLLHQNRLRELVQFILNADYTIPLVEKWAAYCEHVADADEDRWDWYPMPVIQGEPWPSGWLTQTGRGGTSAQQGQYRSHAVRMQQLKDWIAARSNSSHLRDLPIGYADPDIPDTPTNLSPADGAVVSGQFVLRCSPFADANSDGHSASRWIVIQQGGEWLSPLWDSAEDTKTKTFIEVPSGTLEDGHTYLWRVKWEDSSGRWSFWSQPSSFRASVIPDATAPSAPGDLTAIAPDYRTVILSWRASSDAESGIVGYEIYRDDELLEIGLGQLTYTDKGVAESTAYLYKVVAVNGGGMKSFAAELVGTTPPDDIPPSLLSAGAPNPNTILVTFDEPVSLSSAQNPANYRVSNGVRVLAAVLQEDRRTAQLTTTTLTSGHTYTLLVYDVSDRSPQHNSLADGAALQFAAQFKLHLSGVSLTTGSVFKVLSFAVGNYVYSDRSDYLIAAPIPQELSQECFQILVPNSADDRSVAGNYVTFETNLDVEVWVGYRSGPILPSWLDPSQSDWQDGAFTQLVNKSDGTDRYHDYYKKAFPAGSVAVPGNANASISSYLMVVRPLPPPNPDADNDDLSDQWEIDNFGDISASPHDDPDRDGQSNLSEFRAGTNPLDDSSFFSITSILRQSDEITLTWTTAPYRYYQPYASENLLGPWTRLGQPRDSSDSSLVDAVGAGSRRFYRVETW